MISKIFNKIILERIKNSLEMSLQKEQAGFHHNRSCIDQINTLRVIIEQSVEFRSPLYAVCGLTESFRLLKQGMDMGRDRG